MKLSPTAHSLFAGAALGALVLSGTACKRAEPAAPTVRPAEEAAPVRVTAAAAQVREVPTTLALTGTLVPDQQSELTAVVAGRVTEVMVERGTVVRAGQPLVRLRDVDFRSSAAAATAALEQARARLGVQEGRPGAFDPEQTAEVRNARVNRDLADDALRRAQQLAASGSISDQDLQRTASQAASAREQYTSSLNGIRSTYYAYQNARVAVEQTRRAVADSIVRAPFDGEIAEKRINVGEYVTPQRALVTLVRTNPLRIELQIPQERIPYVSRGQRVAIHVDAFPDRNFEGTIRYISAAVGRDTRSLVAEAEIPNADGALRPGIFVTARLDLNRRERLVVVPASAVLTEAGTSRIFVVRDGRIQERVVTVSTRTNEEVLISQGLETNERVATTLLDRLSDGSRVTE